MAEPDSASPAAAAASEPRAPVPFEFRGTGGEYFRIWIVNLCLTILTLGIYSAWAKVRRNRYFASSTRLRDASFAYLAEPLAILKGRALVLAFFVVYVLASSLTAVADAVFGLAVMLLLPWAIIRSVAFRARMTAWRNIRFAFGARYGEAFAAYIGLPILGALTLGLLYPNAIYRQRRFLVDHAAFGTTRFRFGSTNADFYKFFGALLLVLVAGVAAVAAGAQTSPVAAAAVGVPLYFFAFGYASSQISNLTYHGAQLGPHRLECRLSPLQLTGIYATNALGILLTLGLFVPWAQIRLARYRLGQMALLPAHSLDEFARAQGEDVSSLGAEFGEMIDLDVGL